MNESMQLKIRKLPKALGELSHSNQFLKISTFSLLVLCGLMLMILFYQTTKAPIVLSITPDGSVYKEAPKPEPKTETERAVREYLKYRYNWTPKTVVANVEQARAFILPSTLKVFDSSMQNVVRFSSERAVAQRVYPVDVEVDLKKGVAIISGDRITSIQGLKAAGDLKLELGFESGPRSERNPWGIYISKEKEFN
ncbi:MAG: hypothetical protein AB7H97_01750 [Pseudobdellovibrionaceae bacterium]